MKRSIIDWMSEPWGSRLPFEHTPIVIDKNATRLQVFAALCAMDTGGYGMITGGGIYGTMGLMQHEAFVWWELRSFVAGFLYAVEDSETQTAAFGAAVRAEYDRVKTAMQEGSAAK